jgi:hypothetical protein
MREFHDTKQLETPLSTYCASLKAISNALRDVGHLLSTPALLLQLVRGLHRRHETTGKLIQDQASTLTFAVAVDKLTMDEQQSKPSSSSSTSALVSFTKQPAPPATPPYTKFFYQYRQCMLQFFTSDFVAVILQISVITHIDSLMMIHNFVCISSALLAQTCV